MAVDDKVAKEGGGTGTSTDSRLPPIGFWSYARQDDLLGGGKLSALRALLMQELQQQYGREQIRLFQDAETIPHGAEWEKEICGAIDTATFFVPIITPNFIQSEWCSREVELFLERQRRLVRDYPELRDKSRIFPILLIGIDDVDAENPDILTALQKLQWFDFRRFRHRSFEDPEVREAIADLAANMRALLRARIIGDAPPPSPGVRPEPIIPAAAGAPAAAAPAAPPPVPPQAAAEPPPYRQPVSGTTRAPPLLWFGLIAALAVALLVLVLRQGEAPGTGRMPSAPMTNAIASPAAQPAPSPPEEPLATLGLTPTPATDTATAPTACMDIVRRCEGSGNPTCVNIRSVPRTSDETLSPSTCTGACAGSVRDRLAGEGLTVSTRIDNAAPGPRACVGFRPDLGGTREGAQCLAAFLGEPYRVGNCTSDGYSYNVYTQ